MSKIKSFSVVSTFAVGLVLATSGCSADVGSTDVGSAEELGETSEALASGNKFYGSDTMKPPVVSAISGAGYGANLVYAGTGTGNGESSLRAAGPAAPNRTLWAPMSRDLTGGCTTGADNLKSKRVAIDGIVIDTATTNTATNVTAAELGKLFCAAGAGAAAVPCSMPQAAGGTSVSKAYRRDGASGTTDTFLSILNSAVGCTALCSDANHITVTETSHPAQCTGGISATQCIGKLTQTNFGASAGTFVVGYAGLSSLTVAPPPKVLNVNGVDPDASSFANIRNFSYLFSRYLYTNYNLNMLQRANAAGPSATNATATERRSLCELVFGGAAGVCAGLVNPIGGAALVNRKLAFENELVTKGDFLRCDPLNPLNCSATGVACP